MNNPVKDNDGTFIPCGDNVFACEPDAKNGIANCAAGKSLFSLVQGSLQTVVGESKAGVIAGPIVAGIAILPLIVGLLI
ncbi:hypothetical protein E6O75_ATG03698 [Venturia nashicola]|uniref:Uncharacterized protein n=1 Tax=Venturia nashicola TaxID=86259 RepID=A0A4Z1PB41_9PEZI|nr:hypothetical protein E6O75_ATG03698 [Venturia nashicola]